MRAKVASPLCICLCLCICSWPRSLFMERICARQSSISGSASVHSNATRRLQEQCSSGLHFQFSPTKIALRAAQFKPKMSSPQRYPARFRPPPSNSKGPLIARLIAPDRLGEVLRGVKLLANDQFVASLASGLCPVWFESVRSGCFRAAGEAPGAKQLRKERGRGMRTLANGSGSSRGAP